MANGEAKDGWDKFQIVNSFLSTVLLASIPILLSIAAAQISNALERGKTVDTLIDKLVVKESTLKRDIALSALHEAIPQKQSCFLWVFACVKLEDDYDVVADVAELMMRDGIQDNATNAQRLDSEHAAKILRIRKPNLAKDILQDITKNVKAPSDATTPVKPTEGKKAIQEIEARIKTNATVRDLLEVVQGPKPSIAPVATSTLVPPNPFENIKIVYIQFKQNREKAAVLQQHLRSKGVLAPGIQKITKIVQSDIRYPNTSDLAAAEKLRSEIAKTLGIQESTIKLVDLSRGFKVPDGQFEIWLNL
jgi:hypothetical protein